MVKLSKQRKILCICALCCSIFFTIAGLLTGTSVKGFSQNAVADEIKLSMSYSGDDTSVTVSEVTKTLANGTLTGFESKGTTEFTNGAYHPAGFFIEPNWFKGTSISHQQKATFTLSEGIDLSKPLEFIMSPQVMGGYSVGDSIRFVMALSDADGYVSNDVFTQTGFVSSGHFATIEFSNDSSNAAADPRTTGNGPFVYSGINSAAGAKEATVSAGDKVSLAQAFYGSWGDAAGSYSTVRKLVKTNIYTTDSDGDGNADTLNFKFTDFDPVTFSANEAQSFVKTYDLNAIGFTSYPKLYFGMYSSDARWTADQVGGHKAYIPIDLGIYNIQGTFITGNVEAKNANSVTYIKAGEEISVADIFEITYSSEDLLSGLVLESSNSEVAVIEQGMVKAPVNSIGGYVNITAKFMGKVASSRVFVAAADGTNNLSGELLPGSDAQLKAYEVATTYGDMFVYGTELHSNTYYSNDFWHPAGFAHKMEDGSSYFSGTSIPHTSVATFTLNTEINTKYATEFIMSSTILGGLSTGNSNRFVMAISDAEGVVSNDVNSFGFRSAGHYYAIEMANDNTYDGGDQRITGNGPYVYTGINDGASYVGKVSEGDKTSLSQALYGAWGSTDKTVRQLVKVSITFSETEMKVKFTALADETQSYELTASLEDIGFTSSPKIYFGYYSQNARFTADQVGGHVAYIPTDLGIYNYTNGKIMSVDLADDSKSFALEAGEELSVNDIKYTYKYFDVYKENGSNEVSVSWASNSKFIKFANNKFVVADFVNEDVNSTLEMTLTVAGETIGKTLSIPVTVAKVGDLSMVNGASICLLPNTFGIRFTAKVNYQDATKVFESVEFGILFTKKSNVNSADDFTFEGLEGKEYVNYSSENEAFDYAQNGSEYTFSYQVTGLSADDLNTDYTARVYIRCEIADGEYVYYYSDWSEENNVRNMYEIAQATNQVGMAAIKVEALNNYISNGNEE